MAVKKNLSIKQAYLNDCLVQVLELCVRASHSELVYQSSAQVDHWWEIAKCKLSRSDDFSCRQARPHQRRPPPTFAKGAGPGPLAS